MHTVVVVNGDPVLAVTHVAALAADDEHAEVGGRPGTSALGERHTVAHGTLVGAADAHVLLVLLLVTIAGHQGPSHLDALVDGVALGRATPGHELVGQEVAVAVVYDGRRPAVLELHVGRVVAGHGPFRHPLPGGGANAAQPAAAEQTYRIYLVRPLTIRDAAALVGVELVRGAWPQHPV